MDNEELKDNLTSGNQWMRLLYMVLFVVLLEIAGFVMLAVVILQFLFSIFSGEPNDNLRRLGDQIASYVYQTLQFLVYNTEEKPFPFAEWPESEVEDLSGYESAEEVEGEVVGEEKARKEDVSAGQREKREKKEEKSKGAGAYVPVELGTEGEYEGEKKGKSSPAGKDADKKDTDKKASASKSSASKGSTGGSKGNGSKSSSSSSSSSSGSSASGTSASSGKSATAESSADKSEGSDK